MAGKTGWRPGRWFHEDDLRARGVDEAVFAAIMAGRHQQGLASKRASVKRLQEKWTPEQWEIHRERARQQSKAKLARETPEQREHRLNYLREYGRRRPRKHRTKQS